MSDPKNAATTSHNDIAILRPSLHLHRSQRRAIASVPHLRNVHRHPSQRYRTGYVGAGERFLWGPSWRSGHRATVISLEIQQEAANGGPGCCRRSHGSGAAQAGLSRTGDTTPVARRRTTPAIHSGPGTVRRKGPVLCGHLFGTAVRGERQCHFAGHHLRRESRPQPLPWPRI